MYLSSKDKCRKFKECWEKGQCFSQAQVGKGNQAKKIFLEADEEEFKQSCD